MPGPPAPTSCTCFKPDPQPSYLALSCYILTALFFLSSAILHYIPPSAIFTANATIWPIVLQNLIYLLSIIAYAYLSLTKKWTCDWKLLPSTSPLQARRRVWLFFIIMGTCFVTTVLDCEYFGITVVHREMWSTIPSFEKGDFWNEIEAFFAIGNDILMVIMGVLGPSMLFLLIVLFSGAEDVHDAIDIKNLQGKCGWEEFSKIWDASNKGGVEEENKYKEREKTNQYMAKVAYENKSGKAASLECANSIERCRAPASGTLAPSADGRDKSPGQDWDVISVPFTDYSGKNLGTHTSTNGRDGNAKGGKSCDCCCGGKDDCEWKRRYEELRYTLFNHQTGSMLVPEGESATLR